ncbi:MAG: hypothetical protein KDB27_27740 [Planctomycetales bacterium]|nr:hypothetical protein [Planctomycetales bacterium]
MRFTTAQKIRRLLNKVEKAITRFFNPRWLRKLTKSTSKTLKKAESQVARSTRKVTKGVAQSAVGRGAKDAQKFGSRFQKNVKTFFLSLWKTIVVIASWIIPQSVRTAMKKVGKRIWKRFRTLFQFIGRWLKTRQYSLLIGGIPAIAMTGVLMYFLVRIPLQTNDSKVRQYTRAVEIAIGKKDSTAADLFQRQLTLLGGMTEQNQYRAALYKFEQGNFEEALTEIKALAPLDKDSRGYGRAHSLMALWILSGEVTLPEDDVWPTAEAHINLALRSNDNDPVALAARMELYKQKGLAGKAILEFESLNTESPAINLSVVELYLSQGKLEKAKETLRKIDKYYQDRYEGETEINPMGYLYWTQTKLLLGEFQEADRLFKIAAEKHADDEDLKQRALDYFVIMAELSRGPTAQSANRAMDYIRLGLRLVPDSRTMLTKLVNLASGSDEASKIASEEIKQILAGENPPAILWSMVGTLEASRGNLDKALPLLMRGAEENPKDELTLNNCAWVQMKIAENQASGRTEDLKTALELVDRALALKPNWPKFLETRGEIFLAMGQPKNAIEALEKCVNGTDKPTPTPHELLAKAYQQLKDPGVAEMHRDIARRLRSGTFIP